MALTQAGLGGSSWPWWFKLALVVQDGLGSGSSWPWWFKMALVVVPVGLGVVQAGLGGGVMRGTCDG